MAAPKTLAPCKICIRAQAFVLRCGAEVARIETAIWRTFSAIIADEDFADCFRARIHDRVDHRRGADRRWKNFAMIGRFAEAFHGPQNAVSASAE